MARPRIRVNSGTIARLRKQLVGPTTGLEARVSTLETKMAAIEAQKDVDEAIQDATDTSGLQTAIDNA